MAYGQIRDIRGGMDAFGAVMISGIYLLCAALQTAPPQVSWEAPARCPAAAFVTEEIAGLIDVSAPSTDAITVRVGVEEIGSGFVAHVWLQVGTHEVSREISGDTCEMVARAVAMVVAVQVDALAAGEVDSPPLEPELDNDSSAVTEPVEHASVEPEKSRNDGENASHREQLRGSDKAATVDTDVTAHESRGASSKRRRVVASSQPLIFAVRAGVGVVGRTLPAPALGVSGGWSVMRGGFRADLWGVYVLPRGVRVAGRAQAAGIDISLAGGGAKVGYVPRYRRVEFPLSVGLEMGALTARGVELSRAQTQRGFWAAGVASGGLMFVPVPRVAIGIDSALVLGLARTRFAVLDQDRPRELFQPPIAGLRLLAGAEVRFW